MNGLFSKFRRDINGIFWLGTAAFLVLALVSYTPLDPSFNSMGNSFKVNNYCGVFGSFLADLLLQGFGLAAYFFVVISLRKAWLCFFPAKTNISIGLLWAVLLLITSSSLLTLYFGEVKIYDSHLPIGGLLGLVVTNVLIKVFNFVGVSVILWSAAVILIIFYTERPIRSLLLLPAEFISKVSRIVGLARWPLKKLIKWQAGKATSQRGSTRADSISREAPVFNQASNGQELFIIDQKETVKSVKKEIKKRRAELQSVIKWDLPQLTLLDDPPILRNRIDEKDVRHKAELLVDKLAQFDVDGEVVDIRTGPAVSLFEFKPKVDVPVSKITKLENDLSLALSSESVRIIAPIPGRDVVGIETSNTLRETVFLKDIITGEKFWDKNIVLPIPLGRQANGTPQVVDLRKMPHLLVAGSTGSGKSVFTVSTICGLLLRHSPETLKLIVVDPKQVDLAIFDEIPHLAMPIVTETKKAVNALKWAVSEMDKRYRSLKKFGVRKLEEFNEAVESLTLDVQNMHKQVNEEYVNNNQQAEQYYYTPQPYLVIFVEEFSDLMSVDKINVEHQVVRLAQKARAAGIHLFLAMQSPRKDVLTGLVKTNIPGRISFKVASKTDSRIILDDSGAERLLAQGDMLFLSPGVSKSVRHHGPWVSDKEVNRVVEFWKAQATAAYDNEILKVLDDEIIDDMPIDAEEGPDSSADADDRYDEILAEVANMKEVSASMLQRRFRLGYPRAARMIEIFEKEGVVGPAQGSKPRQVLVNNN